MNKEYEITAANPLILVRGRVLKNKAHIVCNECGKAFERNDWVTAKTALAGHIMAKRDHYNKRWAKNYLLDAKVGFGDDEK